MGFFAAVRSAVWTNYFQLNGRASRAEYWWFILFCVLALIVTAIPDSIIFDVSFFSVSADADAPSAIDSIYLLFADPKQLPLLGFVFGLLAYIPSITLTVRRLHDIGWSGYWAGLFVILTELLYMLEGGPLLLSLGLPALPSAVADPAGFILLVLFILLGLINSQIHDNQYGPVPPHKRPQAPQPHEDDAAEPPGSRST